jgi:hypothetical protein
MGFPYSLKTMARVYGSSPLEQPALQTSRGAVSRLCDKRSGMAVAVRKSKCLGSR